MARKSEFVFSFHLSSAFLPPLVLTEAVNSLSPGLRDGCRRSLHAWWVLPALGLPQRGGRSLVSQTLRQPLAVRG